MSPRIEVIPVEGLPEIEPGAPLGELIAEAGEIDAGDVVAISQKVVSKAEGRARRLAEVEPSARARELAAELDKDPALIELALGESVRIVRAERGVLVTETRQGPICANAGIDASNAGAEGLVLLLPEDPDGSARRLRAELAGVAGVRLAVLVTDSLGRPWRLGQSEVAIGCAGLEPLDDWRGRADRDGRELTATAVALADQLAAAADLCRSKDGGVPAAIVRGLGEHVTAADGPGAAALRRPADDDLFR